MIGGAMAGPGLATLPVMRGTASLEGSMQPMKLPRELKA